VAASSNPQPKLEYVVAVLGGTVKLDTSLTNVLSDITGVTLPSSTNGSSSAGTVPAAIASILAAAQTDYQNAQAALKAQDLSTYQADIAAMEQQLASAQDVLNATTGPTTTTTTTTIPKLKGTGTKKTSGTTSTTSSTTTTSTSPTSTEPRNGSTTTSSTNASAAGVVSGGGR
jgi:serine/threonine-protein kinase